MVESLSRCLIWPGFLSGFPQVRRRHAVLPGLTDSPPQDPSQAIFFFKEFVNSSQKHTLQKFISSKHLTQKPFVLVPSPDPSLPPSRWAIGGRSTQAISISTDGSLNRRRIALVCLHLSQTSSFSLFSSPVGQQALARFMNAGNKKSLSR